VGPADGDVLGGSAWLPDLRTGDVLRVSAQGVVLRKIPTGLRGPFVLCVFEGAVWTGDWMGTDVVRVDPRG
jgi:hypothetical protein